MYNVEDIINQIHNNDCLEFLHKVPDNSIDSCVTDPPYGISFMNKHWDYDVPKVDVWKEVMRVLKPGGHLLCACGTRTQHRMAVNIEDAGFEVRDIIAWIYGSGFPKSLSVGKAVNAFERNKWLQVDKALHNINQKSIMELWQNNSNNVKIVQTQLLNNQIIVGQDMPNENFVPVNVAEKPNQRKYDLLVNFVAKNLQEVQVIDIKINTVLHNVEVEIKQSQNLVKSAEQLLPNQNHKSLGIFTVGCNVKEWLKENTEVNRKVDEALKTVRGDKKYLNEDIISVLCAVLIDTLKLTILNLSKNFQSLDTILKMEYVPAINVIITAYTAENLILNMVAILRSKAVDKMLGNTREVVGDNPNNRPNCDITNTLYQTGFRKEKGRECKITKGSSEFEGWGTALKPAMELWTLARKPLDEKSVAENAIKWRTGGINIDACRVPIVDGVDDSQIRVMHRSQKDKNDGWGMNNKGDDNPQVVSSDGRFPANVIHDGSPEVIERFPTTHSGKMTSEHTRHTDGSPHGIYGKFDASHPLTETYGDTGSASRFFYCAKVNKSERNAGCDDLADKDGGCFEGNNDMKNNRKIGANPSKKVLPTKNNHPTVKPLALMRYLTRLITPQGGIVIDPFCGSGSTCLAAKQERFHYIGIEKELQYCDIARRRVKVNTRDSKLVNKKKIAKTKEHHSQTQLEIL